MRETERHVAWTKVEPATVRPEQVDKGEYRTLVFWPRGPDANSQAQTRVNPVGWSQNSVVKSALSDEGNGCAETFSYGRRQHSGPELGREVQGHPGVYC